MRVLRVTVDQDGIFSVFLTDIEEKMVLPIGIGPFEAQAIAFPLQGGVPPRPLTHDLLKSFCEAMGATVEKIVITNMKDGVFYAEIHLNHNGKKVVLDARPSDAIALAIRCECPIYMAPRLVEFTYKYEDLVSPDQGGEDSY